MTSILLYSLLYAVLIVFVTYVIFKFSLTVIRTFDLISDSHSLYMLNEKIESQENNTILFLVDDIDNIPSFKRYIYYFLGINYFTLDDTDNIGILIKEAQKNNKGLDIFIQSYGGCAISSDYLISKISVFRKISKKPVRTFVPNFAKSAGTMLALSSNKLYINHFSFLGPVDPVITTEEEEDENDENNESNNDDKNKKRGCVDNSISVESFFESISRENIVEHCDIYSVASIKDSLKLYRECQRLFREFPIVKRSSNAKKTTDTFCNGELPHHHCFTFMELDKLGIKYELITEDHNNLFNAFIKIKMSKYY